MIKQPETGLTSTQYAHLQAQRDDAIYRVTAYRWQPQFASDITPGVGGDFAMIPHGGTLYWVGHDLAKVLNDGSWVALSGYTAPTNGRTGAHFSMISETNLYVFALTTAGIVVNSYNGSWSGWSTVVSDSTTVFMAATDKDTVHYIVYDSSNQTYQLKVATFSGSWSVTGSDIYWPFAITSFDAVHFNGQDNLIMTAYVPGEVSAQFLNNRVVKYALNAGGVVHFTYQYGSWSDHHEIDIIDDVKPWYYRSAVRASVVNDKLWVTAYCSDGSQLTPSTGYRTYITLDGLHWSHAESLPISTGIAQGMALAVTGTAIYASTGAAIYKAPETLLFGASDSSNQMDITAAVAQIQISRQDMQQLQLLIDNEGNWLNTTFLNGQCQIMLKLETGYWASGEPLLVQTGLFELDTFSLDESLPEHMLELTGRDWLAFMQSKYQAEQFKFWQPQIIGADDYTDYTTTGYGGMGHTAVEEGAFQTIDGGLLVADSEIESMWLSAFVTNTWNGVFWLSITPALADEDEFFGIVFRAQDHYNCWLYYYEQTSDKLRLDQRKGGSDTNYWLSSAKSWHNSLNTRWLMVEFRYCRIKLYSSSDGKTWTLEQSVLVPGAGLGNVTVSPDGVITSSGVTFFQAGTVGGIGKGYSDIGAFSPDPGVIIPAPTLPAPIIVPAPLTAPARFWVTGWDGSNHPQVSRLDLSIAGSWTFENSGLPSSYSSVPVGMSNPANILEKWITTGDAVYKCNLWDASPTWTQWFTNNDVFGSTTPKIARLWRFPNQPNWIAATAAPGLYGISQDNGVSWSWSVIFAGSFSGCVPYLFSNGDGTIYALLKGVLYVSQDWGQTWGLQFNPPIIGGIATGWLLGIVLPYRNHDGSLNLDHGSQLLYGIAVDKVSGFARSNSYLVISNDGGQTWTTRFTFPDFGFGSPCADALVLFDNFKGHPNDSDTLFTRGYYSRDGGNNWNSITDATYSGALTYSIWPYDLDFLAVDDGAGMAYTLDFSTFSSLSSGHGANFPANLWSIEGDLSLVS